MKFETGQNKFKILGSRHGFAKGWEEWKTEYREDGSERKVPVRYMFMMNTVNNGKPSKVIDPEKPPKFFIAFPVWNYSTGRVEILSMKQNSLYKTLFDWLQDNDIKKMISTHKADIVVTKEGSGMNTKYSMIYKLSDGLTDEMKSQFTPDCIDLSKLFTNEDPFENYEEVISSIGKEEETPKETQKKKNLEDTSIQPEDIPW